MADRRLQVFHAVAKHLSFTKAAEELFMSQPAVTFQVKQLEDEHQTRLFERRHGLVSLTPAGELLRGYAEKILLLSDEVETRLGELSGEMRGLLQIGATSSHADTIFPVLLTEFNAQYPQVRTRLSVANSAELESQVANHALDLALIDHSTNQESLNYEACAEEEVVLICRPDYPLAQKKQLAPAALPEYEYIAREPGSGTRSIFEKYLTAHATPPGELKMLMELGSVPSLKALVAGGLGFGVSGRLSLAAELANKELKAISLKPLLKRSLLLISAQDRYSSRATRTFIDFARSRIREWQA